MLIFNYSTNAHVLVQCIVLSYYVLSNVQTKHKELSNKMTVFRAVDVTDVS